MYEVYLLFGVIAENLEEGSDGRCKVVNLKCLFSDIQESIKNLMNTVTAEGIKQGYAAGSINTGRRGRPKKDVLRAQITYLKYKHFKRKSIAKLLRIHPKTLQRRIQEMGPEENEYSDLSKNELSEIMSKIQETAPNISQSRMMGTLRNRGIKVQRWRLRELMRELDPIGTALRWGQSICQRKYYLPNSRWHIDGNHKLILWRIVIHACIIFLLTGLRIYTGEYKAQGPTLCPTEGRALRGPRALYSLV